MNTKRTIIISIIVLCLGTVSTCSGVQFWFYENGVPTTEPTVVEEFEVVQNAFLYGAYDLHFKVWQKEDNIDIIGWDIYITRFTDGTAKRGEQPEPAHSSSTPSGEDPDNGRHAVDVNARFFPVPIDPNNPFDPNAPLYPYEPHIPYGSAVKVTIKLWLTSWNTIRIADAVWTGQLFGQSKPADIPDHGWSIGFPAALAAQPGQFAHKMSFFNDGDDPIFLSDIQYMPSLENYADFNDLFIEPSLQIPEIDSLVLQGGMSTDSNDILPMDILTEGDFIDNFIYHSFKIGRFAGDPNAMVITARHLVVPPPPPVPTLSEWGLIIMAMLIVSVGVIVIWRRRRIAV